MTLQLSEENWQKAAFSSEDRARMRSAAIEEGHYCHWCDSVTVEPCATLGSAFACAIAGNDEACKTLREFGIHKVPKPQRKQSISRQSRQHSLFESMLNTASGFVLSYLAWIPVNAYVLHRPWKPGEGFVVVAIFTALSIGRNYVWRRTFNRLT